MTKKLGKLEKVAVRDVWPHEDTHFTPWLAEVENIALLSDVVNIELEVQGQEEKVGPFRADILCRDTANDRFVLIENQFGKTDHGHLGQLMTYASGLNAVSIIWIAEKFTEEHRASWDWLNRITDESVEFYGIEIELYRIGNSDPAPVFNIVSKPNNWSKTIKRTTDNEPLTGTKKLQLDFWTALSEFVEKGEYSYKMTKPLPQHWMNISIGRTGFKICPIANMRDKWIAIQLNVHGIDSLADFTKLRELYQEDSLINLSSDIEWAEKEGKEHHVNLLLNLDPNNQENWPDEHRLLADWIEKFSQYFKKKILEL